VSAFISRQSGQTQLYQPFFALQMLGSHIHKIEAYFASPQAALP